MPVDPDMPLGDLLVICAHDLLQWYTDLALISLRWTKGDTESKNRDYIIL